MILDDVSGIYLSNFDGLLKVGAQLVRCLLLIDF